MLHSDLLTSLAIALVAAFAGGFAASWVRLPAILGYLLVGVAIGPFTPGFTANPDVAAELAEVGVILLMFGVGLHFSLRDLLAVRSIAIPGAVGQIAVATSLGAGLALWWGWTFGAALVLGLAVSVASTVVLLRALEDRGTLSSSQGHVAVGWLIVEDLFTVLVLVLLPALAVPLGADAAQGLVQPSGNENALVVLSLALGKAAVFVGLMLFVGVRVIPWLLVEVARRGSRELFTLAVLALALGIAVGSAGFFGVSLALGAFLAGMVISESDLSHQAAADALPMRDAFAVLFFVSVGMLLDPAIFVDAPERVLAVLAIVVIGKGLAAFLIVVLFGYPVRTGLTVAAGLAQIGEFSFILAAVGRELGLFPEQGTNLVLAGALLSIATNPLLFRAIDPLERWLRAHPRLAGLAERRGRSGVAVVSEAGTHELRNHAVLCGYGRVGRVVAGVLRRRGLRYLVVENDRRVVEALRAGGGLAVYGDAARPTILQHAQLETARVLVVAISDAATVRQVVEYAHGVNPRLDIVVRTHSEAERAFLQQHGVGEAVLGEWETALELSRRTLHRFGVSLQETQAIVQALRARGSLPDDGLPARAGTS